jgi:RNA polymerase sigma-70 factor, ECF subfamily
LSAEHTNTGDQQNPMERVLIQTHGEAAEEARLMLAARDDLSRFAPLYERYAPRIYAYCARRVDDPNEAEDLTSQVFTRAMVGIHTYRGGMVAAWLFQIARNVIAAYYESRKTSHKTTTPLDEIAERPDDSPEPFEKVAQDEERARLRRLVETLPSDQQHLLALKLSGGLSTEDIAGMLGRSPGAVRVALHRLLRRLYELYREPNDNPIHKHDKSGKR